MNLGARGDRPSAPPSGPPLPAYDPSPLYLCHPIILHTKIWNIVLHIEIWDTPCGQGSVQWAG